MRGDDFRQRLDYFRTLLQEIERESKANAGMIRRQDTWRASYFRDPYMIRITESQLFQRFCDIFSNLADLSDQGQLTMTPSMQNDGELIRKWTHLLEETGARGGVEVDLIEAARRPLFAYFADGIPLGVQLFQGIERPKKPFLVKYSENEFIDRMHRHGEIRIAPATFYARGSLLFAMQDLETKRDFTIPAYNNLLKGQRLVEVEGQRYDISASDPSVVLQVPDYFLYSLCSDMSRRMPTDFNSNSALLIKDPKQFQRKFFDAVSEKISGWDFKNGNVSYYDPLLDFKKYRVLEMTKHIRFRYQNEFRLVARPKKATKVNLEPFFINIGSMQSYSEIHSLN